MAHSFEFLYPSNTSHISSTPLEELSGVSSLSFSRNNRPIIYANYPEQIGKEGLGLALAENGWCVNQQTITAGEAHIFFSHWNRSGDTLKYRVQIYNMSAGSVTITRSNCGFSSGWGDPGETVKEFYNSSSTSFSIDQGKSKWLTDEYSIASEQPFNGMIRFSTTKAVIVTLYAYRSISAIDGTEQVYPYDPNTETYSKDNEVYSGVGTGYFLTVAHGTKNVSGLPYRYVTNKMNANNNEITPISIVGTNYVASEDAAKPLNNLGNWCTQNYHTITFVNNTGSPQTIYGYIGSNNEGNTPVVAKGSNIESVKLETPKRTWKWCRINMDASTTPFTLDYQTILASYGAAPIFHEWSTDNRTSSN